MLKLIYGKSGSGKSTYLYEDIKNNINKEKIFLIVPEQSNLKAEQKLFEYLKIDSLLNVQVLTLTRLAVRILEEVGGDDFVEINNSSKAMIIYDILTKEKDNLVFLGKSEKNIEIVSNIITELKKHNVTVDLLEKCDVKDNLVNLKINDIKLIYKKYQERLNDNFIDENDKLSIVCPKILKTDFFDNSIVYIDDFLGFTPQEYNVFENILQKADNVLVSINSDNLKIGEKSQDIFYFNKVFANKLIEIAENKDINTEYVFLNENLRTKSEDLKYLENAFSTNIPVKLYNKEPRDLELFLANNSYSELEYVANKILKLVKEENYKYKEIAIISNDLDTYNLEAKVIFDKYNIPIFIDEKKDLNQNLLIKYILAILDIFAKNWSFEAVFNYIKLGLIKDVSEEDFNLLENYCRKWGIKNYKWFKPFSIEEKNDVQDRLEEIRKIIVEPLLEFKDNISKNKTVSEITKNIYNFVIENKINVILNDKLNKINNIEISNEYNTSYKIFIDVLNNLVSIFGNQKVNFEDYKNLLQIGFSESELGTIPATQDQVILGDSKRSRNSDIKICFIVGLNDGVFPILNRFEGFLNDDDRENLEKLGIELAKNSVDTMYESNFEIYNVLALASSKLYLSYCSQNKDGKSLRPSILIKKIKRLFPKLKEKSDIIKKEYFVTNKIATFDDCIAVYRDFLDGVELTDEWKTVLNYYNCKENSKFQKIFEARSYKNNAENISEENIEKLYGKRFRGSVSKLEQYRVCPFAFHIKYGLKLKEKEEFKIQSLNTGIFMHEVIDTFFSEIEKRDINIKELSDDELEDLVNKIIDDLLEVSKYYIFTSTPRFRILTKKLKEVTLESLKYIVYTLRNSDFNIYGHELYFGNSEKYKPIIIDLDNGKQVQIEGKIDRLDIGKIDDKTYVRIIDYKSKIKDIDMNKLEAGLQIQLVTYLDAVCKQDNFEPAGILYSGLIDSKFKLRVGKQGIDEAEIKKAIRKNFRMNGVVLANVNIAKMMDNSLGGGVTSDIIPVGLTTGENFDKRYSKILNEEDFNDMQLKVNDIIKEISSEILNGNIDLKPYSYKDEIGCTYCNYKSICRFNPNQKDNCYNYI